MVTSNGIANEPTNGVGNGLANALAGLPPRASTAEHAFQNGWFGSTGEKSYPVRSGSGSSQ